MIAGVDEDGEPAFVPEMVAPGEEEKKPSDGSITIEFGGGLMMRVPGDIPENRIMALVRALRNAL